MFAVAGIEFDVVNESSHGNFLQFQSIPDLDVGAVTRHDFLSDQNSLGSQDVTFLPVGIIDQSYEGRAVRIVLDGSDPTDNAVLIPFEINDPIFSFVSSTTMSNRDFTKIVPTALFSAEPKGSFRACQS